jgi:hypothetical protein
MEIGRHQVRNIGRWSRFSQPNFSNNFAVFSAVCSCVLSCSRQTGIQTVLHCAHLSFPIIQQASRLHFTVHICPSPLYNRHPDCICPSPLYNRHSDCTSLCTSVLPHYTTGIQIALHCAHLSFPIIQQAPRLHLSFPII